MEEKREIKQEKIYDENGKLKYVVIPNYTKTDYFMSKSEIKFYRVLILAITEIREKYKLRLEIFPQVAINRLIKQNNRREKDLEKDLFAKSNIRLIRQDVCESYDINNLIDNIMKKQ